MPASIHIVPAATPDRVDEVRRLLREYAASLGFDLCFQGFDAEIAALPGDYAAPGGALLLAFVGDEVAGCVASRPLADNVCEMKRLYVKPAFRRVGVGRRLATAVIEAARTAGYSKMRLDTVPAMVEAIAMYRSLGFAEIPAYRHNPVEGAVFFELDLGPAVRRHDRQAWCLPLSWSRPCRVDEPRTPWWPG